MRFIALLLCLVASAGLTQEPQISPKDVLSVITTDWNDDGRFDRAVLTVSAEDVISADLYLYLSDSEKDDLLLALHKKNIAWRGAMWGTQPSLSLNERGSLRVKSGNEAIGRNRWVETLTIAYREQHFVVAGYSYESYDTLELDTFTCDLNLLTGDGVKEDEAFRFEIPETSLDNGLLESLLEVCLD